MVQLFNIYKIMLCEQTDIKTLFHCFPLFCVSRFNTILFSFKNIKLLCFILVLRHFRSSYEHKQKLWIFHNQGLCQNKAWWWKCFEAVWIALFVFRKQVIQHFAHVSGLLWFYQNRGESSLFSCISTSTNYSETYKRTMK